MAGPVTLRGVVGRIDWGYFAAAALEGYTVTRSETKTWTLRGTAVRVDAFKLSRRPLVFVAPHQGGEWRWPIVELQIQEGRVSARLGAPLGEGVQDVAIRSA